MCVARLLADFQTDMHKEACLSNVKKKKKIKVHKNIIALLFSLVQNVQALYKNMSTKLWGTPLSVLKQYPGCLQIACF